MPLSYRLGNSLREQWRIGIDSVARPLRGDFCPRNLTRTLHEVHYARHVAMPSGLSLPLAFGMNTRLIGSGR